MLLFWIPAGPARIQQKPLRAEAGCRRASQASLAASMTLEAALALPVFLLSMLALFSVLDMAALSARLDGILQQAGMEAAQDAFVLAPGEAGGEGAGLSRTAGALLTNLSLEGKIRSGVGGDHLCLKGAGAGRISCRVRREGEVLYLEAGILASPFPAFPGVLVPVESSYVCRAWTGADPGGETGTGEAGEDVTVYVTPTGRVYHRDRSCTYLKPSVRAVSASALEKARSRGGAIYYPCAACRPGRQGTVYLTSYGNRYHASASCSQIFRNIRSVPLSSVRGRMRPCSKCGH